MKIVVLDGYTLNPGDISWEEIQKLGKLTVHEHTPPNLVVERAREYEIVLTNKTVLSADIIDSLPKLRYIGVLATGYNVVNIPQARKKNIIVTNVPAYGTNSVAQMTFALILELCHRVQRHSDAVFAGEWCKSRDFCFWNYPLVELDGKIIGIIGLGRIGSKVAKIARAFGMQTIACDPSINASSIDGIKMLPLNELLSVSDVVSLHCPLTDETRGIINRNTLSIMKNTAFLINTSRGPLIIEDDLANALNKKIIAGAALDVLSVEPPSENNPLLKAENCIVTPHIAWASREARKRLMSIAAENIKNFINGTPSNTI